MGEMGDGFDGIICIGGEDWWYHNRGHFDFQIMRRLARDLPVLYVNSIGVRFPSLSKRRVFAQRISRKLKSWARGLVRVENKFSVFSPVVVPGRAGQKLSAWALAPQIRFAARRCGIRRPLLWMHCPAGASLIDPLEPVATIMQRTDRFEAFPEGDHSRLSAQVEEIKRRADLAIYCSKDLMEAEKTQVKASLLVTHGVDFEHFANAGSDKSQFASDLAAIPAPRIGFVGGIDAHTFDPDLLLGLARKLGRLNFVLVGASSLPQEWCDLANVHMLGRKPYTEVADYMAGCDVLIMPWNDSDWIKACNPIKLKEYLATGRPVVSTDFPALAPFRDLVRTADTVDGFGEQIEAALTAPYDSEAARARVSMETWDAKAAEIADAIAKCAPAAPARASGTEHRQGFPSRQSTRDNFHPPVDCGGFRSP